MSSDMNTSAHDGAACASCGEDADYIAHLRDGENAAALDVPLCGDCGTARAANCPECERDFWQKDGYRIGKELRCGSCGSRHPLVCGDVLASLAADEFNERRS